MTGQSRGTFRRHVYPINCLAFSADGTSLVTASSGGNRGGELLSWHLGGGTVQHRVNLEDVEPIRAWPCPATAHDSGRHPVQADPLLGSPTKTQIERPNLRPRLCRK